EQPPEDGADDPRARRDDEGEDEAQRTGDGGNDAHEGRLARTRPLSAEARLTVRLLPELLAWRRLTGVRLARHRLAEALGRLTGRLARRRLAVARLGGRLLAVGLLRGCAERRLAGLPVGAGAGASRLRLPVGAGLLGLRRLAIAALP